MWLPEGIALETSWPLTTAPALNQLSSLHVAVIHAEQRVQCLETVDLPAVRTQNGVGQTLVILWHSCQLG